MSYLDELQKGTNKTRTENGAMTNSSSLDPVLDFFSLAGAMRSTPNEAVKLFRKAYAKDQQSAVRVLFYLRDIRGGQGERNIFIQIMNDLAKDAIGTFDKLVEFVPEYGRWEDLVVLYDKSPATIGQTFKDQLLADEASMKTGESVSMLAKWMPSENASSSESKRLARDLIIRMEFVAYRKRVVALRKYIKLVEQKMSAREWQGIDYSKLPSQAGRKYVKAFKRHDEERYSAFLSAATKGEKKINTGTLYTYEVFDMVREWNVDAANAVWANLPDWTNGSNALVVADVSGSMTQSNGRPMSVSVSLALYFAEHNEGPFKDHFMTFSERPQVVQVVGSTLEDRLANIENSAWGYNTNLSAVFHSLLEAAKASGAKGDDMPRVVYIISDMEFDEAINSPNSTLFDEANDTFKAAGYELPHIVFWNVNARQVQTPATKFDNRVTLISGLSQSTFRYAVEGKSPVELMRSVIDSERYNQIVL